MDNLTFEQMLEIINTGHNQTMDMLNKVIELKRIERGLENEVPDSTIDVSTDVSDGGHLPSEQQQS